MCKFDNLQELAGHYRDLASEAEQAAREMRPSKWQTAYQKMARHLTEIADDIDTVLYAPDHPAMLN